eukprot:464381-Amphidinium_carterae.1
MELSLTGNSPVRWEVPVCKLCAIAASERCSALPRPKLCAEGDSAKWPRASVRCRGSSGPTQISAHTHTRAHALQKTVRTKAVYACWQFRMPNFLTQVVSPVHT